MAPSLILQPVWEFTLDFKKSCNAKKWRCLSEYGLLQGVRHAKRKCIDSVHASGLGTISEHLDIKNCDSRMISFLEPRNVLLFWNQHLEPPFCFPKLFHTTNKIFHTSRNALEAVQTIHKRA